MSVARQNPESATETTATPTVETPVAPSPTRRAMGVDVARAVALIGMVAVHVFPEEHVDGAMSWPFAVFAGRASALFAVLAGVSIAFVEKRSRGQLHGRTLAADRAALVVRGLLILLIGLLLGHLETPIETIIPYFGILFILAVPFYGHSSRFLLIAAPIFAILGPVLRHLLNGNIPEQQPDPEADYTLVTAARQPVLFIIDMLVTGFYPAILWMAYLCVGMVIGRQVLTSRKVALKLVGWGAGLAISTWALSKILLGPAGGMQRLIEATPSLSTEEIAEQLAYGPESIFIPNTTWWWMAVVSPYSDTPLNILHNLGAAVAAIGVILLLTRSGSKVFSPFAAVGTMTLTLYSAHCIVIMLEVLDEERPVVSLWVQIISFMLFAMVWRSAIGKGPLEGIISDASEWIRNRVRTPRKRRPRDSSATEPPTPGTINLKAPLQRRDGTP
ncbi:heparan-alpha-glucosaminide N-acetyltransferase domain-containing protein [Paeniglutamicibacter kerguelensis]|nr:heparan-alpha-glucosaminide N-acetyltransferase domain-containing protein [Paeniglutamicibacter kerguelensis]